jgi:valyl-tRNA synthetase
LGHAYTTIAADVVRRFHTMSSDQTYFLTGTDEHGDKIVRAAKKEGRTPREYVDQISGLFRKLWPELNISNDNFIRTTDPAHMAVVEPSSSASTMPATSISANTKAFTASAANASTPSGNWWTAVARTTRRHRRPSRNPTIFSK